MIFVVAQTYRDFVRWCDRHQLARSPVGPVYVDQEHRLRGTRGAVVICVGDWWAHPDVERIRYIALERCWVLGGGAAP